MHVNIKCSYIGCNKSPATHYFFDEIFIFNWNDLKLKYYIVLELTHLLYESVLVLVVLRGKICEIKIRNQLPQNDVWNWWVWPIRPSFGGNRIWNLKIFGQEVVKIWPLVRSSEKMRMVHWWTWSPHIPENPYRFPKNHNFIFISFLAK